ncbi:MAG: helix-turn-helix domain-containing protein [Oleiphilaceae bacterium]|nr:helix-turn-helix domain-containing protein [Oleiphilaceae bacterium]
MTINIQVLLADGCSAASVAACLEGFECANILQNMRHHAQEQAPPAHPLFQVHTTALSKNTVTCTGGMSLHPQLQLGEAPRPDLLIVPGFMFHILPVLPRLQAASPLLQTYYAEGTHLAAMCTGAFVLAEAGLLDGRMATTHWFFSEIFAQRYPKVALQSDRVVTDDGNIQCSGGATGGNDLLLYLLRKYGSAELANECAKKLLVDTRERSQNPYMSFQAPRQHEDQLVHKVQDWVEQHLAERMTLERIAREYNTSVRQLIRRFKAATQMPPGTYIQNLRLERAKEQLECSDQQIDKIAYKVGYEDSNAFRRVFGERIGLSPSAYRKRFRR